MEEKELWKKSIWLNSDIDFIFGTKIVEYDMKSAGLSLIKEFKLLDENTINSLDKMSKEAKNKKIGLLQRNDKEFAKKLSSSFKEARKLFLINNNIDKTSLLSIKKDALFVINTQCKELEFGYIKFQKKNIYSTFFKLNHLEFFINTENRKIDIKGLGQGDELNKVLELHGPYMLKFIMTFTEMRESGVNRKRMFKFLNKFITNYKSRLLDIGYYRELDKGLGYEIYDEELEEFINVSDTDEKDKVSITANYVNYILPLASIYI